MKIITIYAKPTPGGCFSRLCKMIIALAKDKNEVHYLSTVEFPINHPKVHFHKVPLIFKQKNLLYPQFFLFSLFLSYRVIIREKIDLIIVFGTIYALTGLIGKLLNKIQIIIFIRGDLISELHAKKQSKMVIWFIIIIEKIALKLSDNVISVSEDLKNKYLSRYCLKQVDVIINNIDTSIDYPRSSKDRIFSEFSLKENNFLIGYVGTFDKIKNIDHLIHAFKQISIPNTTLLLVGDGVEMDSLKQLVSTLDIQKKVIFSGWRNDIPDVLSALDLMVLPSDYEGCPGIILECLGCQTPCIGSDVGGISELLGYSELLFQSSDIDELSYKIQFMIENPDHYDKIKQLCSNRKEQLSFNWDKIINTYLEKQKKISIDN